MKYKSNVLFITDILRTCLVRGKSARAKVNTVAQGNQISSKSNGMRFAQKKKNHLTKLCVKSPTRRAFSCVFILKFALYVFRKDTPFIISSFSVSIYAAVCTIC
jgi:hypothetical protein